jgi:hypothetical protein
MKLDLPQPEIWERLNDAIKKSLFFSEDEQIRVFSDLSSAVFEIAQGTAQFLSHKKAMASVKGQTPAFEFLLPYFYKEAYEVQQISHLAFQEPEKLKDWVTALKRETCFVIYAEDNPITGEIFPFADELDRLLNERKIYSFRISHAQHFFQALEIKPYTTRICAFAPDLAIAICGDRFRSPALVAPRQQWDAQHTLRQLETCRAQAQQDRDLILTFEKEISAVASATPWFKTQTSRIWDRSAIVFSEVSAEPLLRTIFAKIGLTDEQGWQKMDTTNLCRQGSVRLYQSWWEPLPSDDALSSLVLFSVGLLRTKDFAKLVLSSYEEIKSQQSWTA